MNALVLTRPVRLLQPKCHVIVSKNGGCHDIGCSCGAHFCWLCGQVTGLAHSYENIAGHTCGRYKKVRER